MNADIVAMRQLPVAYTTRAGHEVRVDYATGDALISATDSAEASHVLLQATLTPAQFLDKFGHKLRSSQPQYKLSVRAMLMFGEAYTMHTEEMYKADVAETHSLWVGYHRALIANMEEPAKLYVEPLEGRIARLTATEASAITENIRKLSALMRRAAWVAPCLVPVANASVWRGFTYNTRVNSLHGTLNSTSDAGKRDALAEKIAREYAIMQKARSRYTASEWAGLMRSKAGKAFKAALKEQGVLSAFSKADYLELRAAHLASLDGH